MKFIEVTVLSAMDNKALKVTVPVDAILLMMQDPGHTARAIVLFKPEYKTIQGIGDIKVQDHYTDLSERLLKITDSTIR